MRLASISSVALGTLNIRESDMRAGAPVVYSPAHAVFPIEMVAANMATTSFALVRREADRTWDTSVQ